MKLSVLERFTFNSIIAPEQATLLVPGCAHIVCTDCYKRFDDPLDLTKVPPVPPDGDEYWYVWMLDHPASVLMAWMLRHLNRWHPSER